MASLEELKDALRDTLAARGSLGQIQARVRAEIFSALEESVRACPLEGGCGWSLGVGWLQRCCASVTGCGRCDSHPI